MRAFVYWMNRKASTKLPFVRSYVFTFHVGGLVFMVKNVYSILELVVM